MLIMCFEFLRHRELGRRTHVHRQPEIVSFWSVINTSFDDHFRGHFRKN